MQIYDQQGRPLDDYDPNKGRLEKSTRTVHHAAVEGVEEQGHWETIREYPETGGKDVAWVVDVPGAEAKDAWDEESTELVYIPYTEEELTAIDKRMKREIAIREVQEALITTQINTLSVNDKIALRWKLLYPEWELTTKYEIGIRVQYQDRLYRCLQEHVSQIGWEPINVPALWTEIDETHSGTIDDPIPYNNNMALEKEKYYIQSDVKYRCIRDTINPVYNDLKDLIGLYVEAVE